MEIKKSSRADLERGWGLRFGLGLAVVLALCYIAFQWKTVEKVPSDVPMDEVLPLLPEESQLPPVAMLPEETMPTPTTPETLAEEVQLTDMDHVETVDNSVRTELQTDIREAIRTATAYSATVEEEIADLPVAQLATSIVRPDTLPCFPGGDAACMRFLSRHVRYPSAAVNGKVKGCVHVQFIVEADGKLSDFQVVESVSPVLDREALRVVKLMPRWNPGRRNGKPARFLYVLPVDFRLR